MKEEIKLLVEQARNGSQKAFSELYNTYKKTIWWTAFKIVKNIDVADDIVSIVFTKAYEKLDTFTNHISFEMWLKTIAINTAIDYIRKNKKEQLNSYIDDEDNNIQLNGIDSSPEENLIGQQTATIIEDCLKRLKIKHRKLIMMKLEGKTYNQIAEELALSVDAVKSQLSNARKRLKQLINNY